MCNFTKNEISKKFPKYSVVYNYLSTKIYEFFENYGFLNSDHLSFYLLHLNAVDITTLCNWQILSKFTSAYHLLSGFISNRPNRGKKGGNT